MTAAGSAELQTALLELLATMIDPRLGSGRYYLSEELINRFLPAERPTPRQVSAAVWSLVAQGLA
jgi:hypothetical protein